MPKMIVRQHRRRTPKGKVTTVRKQSRTTSKKISSFEFEFITDSRFGGTEKKLQNMDKKLKEVIKKMPGVYLKELTKIRELTWNRVEIPKEERGVQWRKKYLVSKSTRNITWNDVMGEINKIQAPYYKRV